MCNPRPCRCATLGRMATEWQALGGDPVDLVAALSLADGAAYLVQVVGRAAVRLAEAAAAPADRAHSHELLPGATWTVEASATPLWAWCDAPGGSAVAATEA